jgi:hypothetical protein
VDAERRNIQIFAPFAEAVDLTKRILFQPFDISKWFVIGFAAFLSLLGGGSGANVNFNFGGKGDWNFRTTTSEGGAAPEWLTPAIIALVVVIFLVVLVLVVVCAWVGAHGRFIFTDCLVRNRAAIVEPWKEYNREANSYFLFWLLSAGVFLAALVLTSAPLWVQWLLTGAPPGMVLLVIEIVGVVVVMLLLSCAWFVLSSFMVPIMYRQRCGAKQGLGEAWRTVVTYPGEVLLYLLFRIVLVLGFILVSCVATCVTCCIAALPYIGTVVLLPLHVFMMSYLLLFVRQFGPEYDAWGNVPALPVPDALLEPPPTTEPPPLPA